MLLEDLQWVDAATLALVDTLLDGLPRARVLMGLGLLWARNGTTEAASREIATARAMLAGMGMTLWVEQADALQSRPWS